MSLVPEIKRKLFHHLALVYLGIFLLLGRVPSLVLLGLWLAVVSGAEFLRVRRPELNAYALERFGGLHRESEQMAPSGVFWGILGVWTTLLIFTSREIVSVSIGFLVFGDTAASLIGKQWGRHRWSVDSPKTIEGSVGFAAVSALWAMLFVKWPAALVAAAGAAYLETRRLPGNDNFWIPVLSGVVLSVVGLVLGR